MVGRFPLRSSCRSVRLLPAALASFAAIALMATQSACAGLYYWSTSSGDWFTASNWGGTLPKSGDTAYIVNGGTVTVSQFNATCGTLSLGGAAGSGSLQMTGGSLTADSPTAFQYVGDSGTGTVTQSGGVNYFEQGSLYLGNKAGSNGTYSLSGSGWLSVAQEYVGFSGTGAFTQAGGTNGFINSLYLGNNVGSSGSYSLGDSGELDTGIEIIGASGSGTFTQSSGTNALGNQIDLGNNPGGSGSYVLSGIGQLSSWAICVGVSGTGTFTQTGSSASASGSLYVGGNAGSSGSYVFNSGQLAVASEIIGGSGPGAFNQSGGTNSARAALVIGNNSGGSGSYSLSGTGCLLASYETVGYSGPGTFSQSGGTNLISGHGLYLATSSWSGTYSLSGSGLLSAPSEYVNYFSSGAALFQQTGGTNMVSLLDIGNGGAYLLAGGTLQVGRDLVNQGVFAGNGSPAALIANDILDLSSGTWQNLGRISLSMGVNSLLIVPAGFNTSTSLASYSTLGLTHTVGSTLTVPAGQGFTGVGSISDHVNCQGTIVASANGAINLNGGLTLSGAGTINCGNLTTTDWISGISGGSLSATNELIGNGGHSGIFSQSGGTNTISNSLYVGMNYGGGTCNLSGNAQLSASNVYVGYLASGVFTQSGGTNTISQSLTLASQVSNSGTYNLVGGLLVVSSLSKGLGTAKLNFTRGTLEAGGSFSTNVPIALGGNGGQAILDTEGYAVTLAGPISGSGNLTKIGSGTLALTGSDTCTGPATISQGKLIVDGWLANLAVSVNGGALGGTGYLSSGTVGTGGILAPGDPLGVLHVSGNLVLASGAAMDYELVAPGSGYDHLEISGQATLNGTLNVNLSSGFTPSLGQSFDLISGATTGKFAKINLPSLQRGLNWDTSDLYTTGTIRVVPEPSTMVLLCVAAIGLLAHARRQSG